MSSMIKLENYRIIDLSEKIKPGVLKVNGEYMHGKSSRKFEIHQFIYSPDKAYMHWVETETHMGTHVELPAHIYDGAKSSADMSLETFIGEAVLIKLNILKPINGEGQSVLPRHLGKVKKGDIVLMWSPYYARESPYISIESAKFLAYTGIKMLGLQNVRVEESNNVMATHQNLLKQEIPIVEGLVNLDKVSKERVFYLGLPLNVTKLDSSWIRAIALE